MPNEENELAEPEEEVQPTPEVRWQMGRDRVVLEGRSIVAPPPKEEDPEPIPERGWKRAVFDLEGEVVRGEWPTLPESIESLSPVMNVLHTAGERALLKRGSGCDYVLFGWPDLRRPNSKVIAIAEGHPLGDVVALHRYPTMSGLCIAGNDGLLLARTYDVEEAGLTITGRKPPHWDGTLFAIQGDAIWIERKGEVFRWDGRRETNDGSPKQVLASLVLQWSNR
jgi:hypothetical protein